MVFMINILHMHKDPLLVVMKMNIEVRFFTFFMLRIFSDMHCCVMMTMTVVVFILICSMSRSVGDVDCIMIFERICGILFSFLILLL